MNKALAIFELMRLDKPIGIYLLLWPALLALVISTNGDFEYIDLLIVISCLLYTSPSPRDRQKSRMPSSA